jgi:histidyl-tRNA synthetase
MINSVGDEASRAPYREALRKYLEPHFEKLSPDSQVRFTKNILRILDSKDEGDQALLTKAPSILEFLSAEAKSHFEKVKRLLEIEKIPYVVNHKLVRGLDYYNKTVFEVISDSLGAHNTLGAGGRYDGLMSALGGPDLPSVGFATGIERLLQTMVSQHVTFPPPPRPILFLIPMGEVASEACFALLCRLRHHGIAVEMDLSGKKIQNGLQLANAENARYSVIVGDRELETGEVEIKEMATRTAQKIPLSKLESFLKGIA